MRPPRRALPSPTKVKAASAAAAASQALDAVRALEAVVVRQRVELEQARARERRMEARLATLEEARGMSCAVPRSGVCV